MVRFGFPSEKGVMGQRLIDDHLMRSGCGAGLVVSEATYVADDVPLPSEISWRPGAYSDDHIPHLSRLCESYHRGGSVFFAQLAHPGFAYYDPECRDISRVALDEIEKIRDGFIRSALRCSRAGLDGVELHGAHSFFLNSLASATANHRDDRYGGDLTGRLNLAREIIEGIKSFSGDRFLVSYRMGWTESSDNDAKTAQALEGMGLDLIHVSSGIPDKRPDLAGLLPGFNEVVAAGAQIKKHVTIPLICVNRIDTIARGSTLIEEGHADFAAYGRPFLADTHFARNALDNPDYAPCRNCSRCQWFTDGSRCPAQIQLGQVH